MATDRKPAPDSAARIEITGFSGTTAAYGGSVEQLPASFWEAFARTLIESPAETPLPPADWFLVEASRRFGYYCAADIATSPLWADFITPLETGEATSTDALHAAFAALSGLGLDACRIADLVPKERLVLHVERYDGLAAAHGPTSPREARLIVCGLCAGVMDLVYGAGHRSAARGRPIFECRQAPGAARLSGCDEFVTRRR